MTRWTVSRRLALGLGTLLVLIAALIGSFLFSLRSINHHVGTIPARAALVRS